MQTILKISILNIIFLSILYAYDKEKTNLNNNEYDKFILGKSFFKIPWVEAPSATTARDGLGPLYNANSCTSCHPKNSNGKLFNKNSVSRSLVARLSLDVDYIDEQIGFIPNQTYGAQLSTNSTFGVKPEGNIKLDFKYINFTYPDKTSKILRAPIVELTNLQYGLLTNNTIVSIRKSPRLVGLGYIEDIDKFDILKNVDEFDKDGDGISAKANFVYDIKKQKLELGRYTYKATSPNITQQISSAFHNDMSLSTSLYPWENCTQQQKECLEASKAIDVIDVPDERVEAISFYLQNLEIPKQDFSNFRGAKLFEKISCNSCHIKQFTTKKDKKIFPFSDFLLHDMGVGLADSRVEFQANKSEWRTTPLWGIRHLIKIDKNPEYLHDGRARDIEEAILWHGGEAEKSKLAFTNLDKQQRTDLIKYIEGL